MVQVNLTVEQSVLEFGSAVFGVLEAGPQSAQLDGGLVLPNLEIAPFPEASISNTLRGAFASL